MGPRDSSLRAEWDSLYKNEILLSYLIACLLKREMKTEIDGACNEYFIINGAITNCQYILQKSLLHQQCNLFPGITNWLAFRESVM